ncbi:MAG: DegT/DnrJ/EryC1/StrS family aminotransferase [Bacteroidetes bacterium]|nr:DegT/DnrJ/EryC1/StrS family aminotransferase [Bacteroidota bacterium]
MKIPFVDLKAQYLSIKNEIDNAVQSVINDTAFIGGKYVKQFENSFADLYKIKNCIGVANGTDAIYITLKMLGIGQGDEVITVANTWISTSETISQAGAKPVFVDINDKLYTIDEELIESKINSKTKAVIAVHLYGQVCNIEKIQTICKKHNLFLIEDCAQSHLSECNGKLAGTFGDAATFSFYPGKNLGAYGDAGCIITNDDALAEKIRMFANHGSIKKHIHEMEGINSRLDGMQAAILSAKLPHLTEWTNKRINNAKLYSQMLTDIGDVVTPQIRENSKHTFHLYVIRTKHRDALKEFLYSHKIETSIHYPVALPNLPAYSYLNIPPEDYKLTNIFQDEILSLPMYPELTSEQITFISEKIKKFFTTQ